MINKIIKKLTLTIPLIWAGVDLLYLRLNPLLMSYNDDSFKASMNQVVQGILAIGPSLLVILMGMMSTTWTEYKLLTMFKTWLNVALLGFLTTVCCAMLTDAIWMGDYWSAMIPIIKNTVPVITGMILGLFITKNLTRLSHADRVGILAVLVFIIAVSGIGQPSVWGWDNNNIGLFYAIIFVVGRLSKDLTMEKGGVKLILIGVINLVLQYVMPYFSLDGATNNRFSLIVSPLNVLIAWLLAKLVIKKMPMFNQKMYWITVTSLTIISQPSLTKSLNTLNIHGAIKVILLSLVVIGLSLIGSLLWIKYIPVVVNRLLGERINSVDQLTSGDALIKFVKNHLVTITQMVISYALAITSQLLVNINRGGEYHDNMFIFTKQQMLIIVNAIIIFSFLKLLQVITKRYWVSVLATTIVLITIIVANQQKIASRSEPVLPADLAMIGAGKELLEMADANVILYSMVGFVFIVLLAGWLEIKHAIKIKRTRSQVLMALLFPVIVISSFFWNNQLTPFPNLMTSIGDKPIFYNQLLGSQFNGPILQFLNNVDVSVMDKPNGYSEKKIKQLVAKYTEEANKINRSRSNDLNSQTIIFNLSESFANPEKVPGVKLKNNPIPYITSMKQKTTAGTMISSGYGGGTANMEYMTLTGFNLTNFSPTLPTPYTQLVPTMKSHPAISRVFKYSTAIHPYYGVFYSRIIAYKKLGFDKFMYFGSKYKIHHKYKIGRSDFMSDNTSYLNTLDQINSNSDGQFINLVTMQNHMPYLNQYKNLSKYRAIKVSEGTDKHGLDTYVTGIHYTDEAVHKFINKIDQINKPITIVFYGDHLPGIYGNDMAKDGLKLHETNYFIYSNRYAREHGAHTLTSKVNFVGPDNFIAMVLKQTNTKVNWQQALFTKVYEDYPTVALNTNGKEEGNNRGQLINQRGKVVKRNSLTKKQRQLWHDYQLIQYDITAGNHYADKYLN